MIQEEYEVYLKNTNQAIDEETKAAADTFKEMFTNAAVAYKLDSRQKSIKYCCSECKGTFYMYDKYDYCPRCGAHIVGVEG